MAKLGHTNYDYQGDLFQPTSRELNAPTAFHAGDVSTDPGFYHVYPLTGRTPTEREQLALEFHDRMTAQVPGYRFIKVIPLDLIGGPGNLFPLGYNRYTARVVYAVERPQDIAMSERLKRRIAG